MIRNEVKLIGRLTADPGTQIHCKRNKQSSVYVVLAVNSITVMKQSICNLPVFERLLKIFANIKAKDLECCYRTILKTREQHRQREYCQKYCRSHC